MFTNTEKLNHMLAFTKAYQENSNNKYMREARCLAVQYSYLMLPVRPQDLFAGRKTELPIGFFPQNSYGTVGYYCDRSSLEEMKKDSSLSGKEQESIDFLLDFWKGKTTNEKIFAKYTAEQRQLLSHGDFNTESGTAWPLYRMSGAQMNPEKLLTKGILGLIADIEKKRSLHPDFYDSIKDALLLLQSLCLQYEEELKDECKKCRDTERSYALSQMAENMHHIAFHKPDTFWQAAQLCYLFYLLSGTYNYGRMDEYLGSYYTHDIDNGIITEPFALTLLISLWELIIERNNKFDGRIILGGKDRKNLLDADRFALAAMEASRQTKDVLPQLTLRCYEGMNKAVYEKALAVIGEGTTYPMLYNDEVNIPAVSNAFNLPKERACEYVPFGCGEYVIYNKSFGTPSGAINFLHGLNTMIYKEEHNYLTECSDFESFYTSYMQKMQHIIELLALQERQEYDVCAEDAPYLYFSILFDDCLERGEAVFEGGVRFLGGTLEGYGNTNTSDSLTAIKKLVYDEKKITPLQLTEALTNNFKGYEEIRSLLLSAPKYGNDDETADAMAVRFHEDICRIIRDCSRKAKLHSYLMVVINNHMNTTFGLTTGASADGRYAYTYMANANNPTGGMDKNGITALLNSLVKLRPHLHAGSVQNMRFSREMFTKLLPKTKGLLSAYFKNGGAQTMITVLNRGDLERAMVEPEKYQNLIVRVGGFSARFVELSKDDQKELLSRTLY